ncbi:hypothetical protein [Allorhodopirellula heiligendammensis]|uniref:Transmembrane Fragile-X-F protein n=1 Tax=Allorhodopirellula heiligendammensis TaxID=2714739 RepID=A0A5C6C2W6_9BACT|nr:hypothetical protein [Allorhodopirellula heiligendammensis]TWU18001.1 hypothetical protein Poly21_01540 [Allorhodopirellula heiligendammensis]
MANPETTHSGGMGFCSVLLLIFITLKLCGVIAWSWLWVLIPLWGPLALAIALFAIAGICLGIARVK